MNKLVSNNRSNASASATWLSEEIVALAEAIGISEKSCQSLRKIVYVLTETIAKNDHETHLKISAIDDFSFLKKACQEPTLGELIGSPKSFLENKITPLIFDEESAVLYFFRHYKQEIQIAKKITEFIKKSNEAPITKLAETIISEPRPFLLSREQQHAVCVIISAPFSIISGGPGTGKTTLLLRALLCMFSENPNAEITLVAPTGKAAARMKESISKQAESLLDDTQTTRSILLQALEKIRDLDPSTLHRALGNGSSTLHTRKPRILTADCVIVDEASMIDQAMMHRLLRSLSPRSRLVLLGDKNQLDSVGPESIFNALCSSKSLYNSRCELIESRRFNAMGILGGLAHAVISGDVSAVKTIVENNSSSKHAQATFNFSSERITPRVIDQALRSLFPEKIQNVPAEADPEEMLDLFETVRVLSPLRNGDLGTEALNLHAKKLFAEGETMFSRHYHGHPILITRNAPQERLFNGNVGIVLRNKEKNGALFAYFRNDDRSLRTIPVALLPEHETAYAMSIHKAQGSEFSRLAIIFPPSGTQPEFFSRQLLYTAITRFQEAGTSPYFHLLFDQENLFETIARERPALSLLPKRILEETARENMSIKSREACDTSPMLTNRSFPK